MKDFQINPKMSHFKMVELNEHVQTQILKKNLYIYIVMYVDMPEL